MWCEVFGAVGDCQVMPFLYVAITVLDELAHEEFKSCDQSNFCYVKKILKLFYSNALLGVIYAGKIVTRMIKKNQGQLNLNL